jgi:uncharacterized protein YhfF
MTFDDIFEAYYTQYRAEADIPTSSEDEYPVAMRLANEAVSRWANYDNTMWQELFSTLQLSGDGDTVIEAGTTEYAAPDDMKLPGGDIIIFNSNGSRAATIPLVPVEETQFMGDQASYAFFIGDPNNGFTLNLNPAPGVTLDGLGINYTYYKKPTLFTAGADINEMGDPYFIVHRMLANRFRSSRNPYYSSAKSDAEDALRTMQLTNNSGNWANPWSLPDHSGSTWGS